MTNSVFGRYHLHRSRKIQKMWEFHFPDFFGFSRFEAEFSDPPRKLSWVLPIPMLSDLNHWVGILASDQLPREASAGLSVYFAVEGEEAPTCSSIITDETCENVLKRSLADLMGCWEV